MMADVESILNEDEFFSDTVDTPKEGVEQHRKRKYLNGVIRKGRVKGKQKGIQERVDKVSNETINKTYGEYKQRELNQKGEKTGRAFGKHVISLCSTGISHVVKIRDEKKL